MNEYYSLNITLSYSTTLQKHYHGQLFCRSMYIPNRQIDTEVGTKSPGQRWSRENILDDGSFSLVFNRKCRSILVNTRGK